MKSYEIFIATRIRATSRGSEAGPMGQMSNTLSSTSSCRRYNNCASLSCWVAIVLPLLFAQSSPPTPVDFAFELPDCSAAPRQHLFCLQRLRCQSLSAVGSFLLMRSKDAFLLMRRRPATLKSRVNKCCGHTQSQQRTVVWVPVRWQSCFLCLCC